ncbi:unnamed protein product [Adineta steineri]|uniref:RING-type domain-containing protein n=1 Tax=Adineta steineri TaxID=433720 RepID=A0A814BUP5_9BILA|nr:unnamed protein product [Adineta steineri]CAF0975046.1 unnamed protein product [Adineta steineri]
MASKSASNQQHKDIDRLISCAICLDYFVDPRLLPCSHTYCLGCIRKIACANSGQFECPMRDGTNIKTNHIDSLPMNRAVRDMVEVLSQMVDVTDQNRQSYSDESDYPAASALVVPKNPTMPYQPPSKTQSRPKAESQEFAVPDACKRLDCKGDPCAKCYKCRDWHFNGDQKQWNWVCNHKNWEDADIKLWVNDGYRLKFFKKRDAGYKLFTLHISATCTYYDDNYSFSVDHYLYAYGRDSFFGHVCLCDKH